MIFLRFFLLFSFIFSVNGAHAHSDAKLRELYENCGLSNKEINSRLKIYRKLTKETSKEEFLKSIKALKPCGTCDVCSVEIEKSTNNEQIYKSFCRQLEKACMHHAKKSFIKGKKNKTNYVPHPDDFDEEDVDLRPYFKGHKTKFRNVLLEIKFERALEKSKKIFERNSREIEEEIEQIEKYELAVLHKFVELGGSYSYAPNIFSYEELEICSAAFQELKATSIWEEGRYKNYCDEYELEFIEKFLAHAQRLMQELADSSVSDQDDLPKFLSCEEESEEAQDDNSQDSSEGPGDEEPIDPKSLGYRRFR